MENQPIKIPYRLFLEFFESWQKKSLLYRWILKSGTKIDIKIHQYTFDFLFENHLPNKLKSIFLFLFRSYIFFLFAAYVRNQPPLNYFLSSIKEYLTKKILLFNLKRIKFFLFEFNQQSNYDLFFPFEFLSEIQTIKTLSFELLCYKANLYYQDRIFKGYLIDLKNTNFFLQDKFSLKLKNIQEISQLSFLSNPYNKKEFRNHLFFLIGSYVWIYSVDIKFLANRIYYVINSTNPNYYIPVKTIKIHLIEKISLEQFYLRTKVK